jgi:hypothetical protein
MDKAEIGWGRDPDKFAGIDPLPPSISAESSILTQFNKDQFQFTQEDIPFYQNLFLERLADLCRRSQIPVAVLNIPQHTERHSDQVIERKNWKEIFGDDVPLIGIPPSKLFAGLSEDELSKLRFDEAHFNANGSRFFTKAMLPAVLQVYKTHAEKDH